MRSKYNCNGSDANTVVIGTKLVQVYKFRYQVMFRTCCFRNAYFLPNIDRMSAAPTAAFAFFPAGFFFLAGLSDAVAPALCVSG